MLHPDIAELNGQMGYAFIEDKTTIANTLDTGAGYYRRWGKRMFDVAVAVASLPFVVPVILLAWVAVKTDGGKGFYSQPRVGRDGRIFKCWKLRTMVPDADAELLKMIAGDPDVAREWRSTQKLASDPRITAFGRMLRRTSIDELPQLWNVLKGDMSLIGPRPFTPNQKAMYDDVADSAAYYTVRPGISGAWQVECRNSGAFQDRIDFDHRYSNNITLVNDLSIAMKTIRVILHATGK